MVRVAEAVARTDTGRQRRGNEDNSLVRSPLFVVADGMGGAQAGEVASQIAVEVFAAGLPPQGSAEEKLAEAVREANRRIHELSRAERERRGMGTTLTAAMLDDTQLAVAHVGDSRGYLFRGGSLTRLTRDHSLVGALVEQGKLTEAEAEEHPQRSIITRALGPEPEVEVDTWSYPVRPGDVLLLCSDGLTSMIREDRIAAVLSSTRNLSAAADRLIDEANAAGGRDNITVVLFELEELDGSANDAQEHRTMVGMPAVAPPSQPSRPDPGARAERRARLARTQGSPVPAEPGRRRNPRWAKPVAALVSVSVVLVLVLGGGYLATRQLYFIGTDARGVMTIYRGLPYELPAGIRLYETFYTSGVSVADVPAARRSSLLSHNLRSQKDASSLMRSIELGQISR